MPHPLPPEHLNQLNLKVLKRHCPAISNIYDQASYVVLYRSILKHPDDPNSKEREWSKKDVHVEGSMFLVEYDTIPRHGFYVLNREGLSDFKHVFRAGDKIEYKTPFIIFQGEGTSEIWGLWIFEPDQRERIAEEFLYYHKLESDPNATPPPTIPVTSGTSPTRVPNDKPSAPTTVDELFQRLALPSTSNSTTTPTGTPLPPNTLSGSQAVPRSTGRRRGESVSAEQPYNPQEGGTPRNIMTAASTAPGIAPQRERKKGKGGAQRPRSVPPQGMADGSQEQQQSGPGGSRPLPQIPQQSQQPQDASGGLKQILGISPNPNQHSHPTPPYPAPPPLQTPNQPQFLPPPVPGPSHGNKNGHFKRKSTQYIPQTTKNEASLVDEQAVKECLVESVAGEGKGAVSQREFVQEVLRLIHTNKDWTKGLYDAYLAKLGLGD